LASSSREPNRADVSSPQRKARPAIRRRAASPARRPPGSRGCGGLRRSPLPGCRAPPPARCLASALNRRSADRGGCRPAVSATNRRPGRHCPVAGPSPTSAPSAAGRGSAQDALGDRAQQQMLDGRQAAGPHHTRSYAPGCASAAMLSPARPTTTTWCGRADVAEQPAAARRAPLASGRGAADSVSGIRSAE